MAKQQLVWFRSDLRILDNSALYLACETAQPVVGLFYVCKEQWRRHDYGFNKIDFILRNVQALKQQLETINIDLIVREVNLFSDIAEDLLNICQKLSVDKVWCNKEYEWNERVRDTACTELLVDNDIIFENLHDQCIVTPKKVLTKDNAMYKVFTPFFKQWLNYLDEHPPEQLPIPTALEYRDDDFSKQHSNFFIDYNTQTENTLFLAGEKIAQELLTDFICNNIASYHNDRNSPSLDRGSKLSAYLSVGCISAKQCYLTAKHITHITALNQGHECWISELCWRDFYRHLIYAKPNLVKHHAFNDALDNKVPWSYDLSDFEKWCRGYTGVPLIDSAMRCLKETGYMHNRLRMVVAMFLTKNLMIDWRMGEKYFMQTLVDADFASNNGGWQWSASIGTDAAPYFRIMNPFTQGKTHDPEATFIKKWLPELESLDPKVIHDSEKLSKVCLSKKYPKTMVDVKQSRKDAIEAFKQAK